MVSFTSVHLIFRTLIFWDKKAIGQACQRESFTTKSQVWYLWAQAPLSPPLFSPWLWSFDRHLSTSHFGYQNQPPVRRLSSGKLQSGQQATKAPDTHLTAQPTPATPGQSAHSHPPSAPHRSGLLPAQTPLVGKEPLADFPVRAPQTGPQRECHP